MRLACNGLCLAKGVAAAIALMGLMADAANAQSSGYFLDPMPAVPPIQGNSFVPKAINSANTIAGNITNSASSPPQSTAYLVTGPQIRTLGGMAGNNTVLNSYIVVSGLSDAGTAAGWGYNASGFERATYWDASGSPWELVPIADRSQPFLSHALAVSATGLIAGYSEIGDSYASTHATLWSGNNGGTAVDLPDCSAGQPQPPGAYFGVSDEGLSISANGQYVSGYCQLNIYNEVDYTAAIWKITQGPPLSGSLITFNGTEVDSVNNAGIGVGYLLQGNNCAYLEGCAYPEIFDATTGLTKPLPLLAPTLPNTEGWANSINNSNVAVGGATAADANDHAVLWSAKGQLTDLHRLMSKQLPNGLTLSDAKQITDTGEILTVATDATGHSSYYRLTPAVPTRTTISSPASTTYIGQQMQFDATVTAANNVIPAGNVNWYDNGRLAGTTPLSVGGTTAFLAGAWGPGVHHVKATYAGQSPTSSSSSGVLQHDIIATPTTTTLSASTLTPVHDQGFTLIAHVSSPYGVAIGAVAFYENGRLIGQSPLTADAHSYAAITVPASGKDSFSAVFLGNSFYVKSSSGILTLTVQ